ncbi:FHA domain-containing protein [Nocardia sp. IFM 10818]
MAICPEGHDSAAVDYCDTCGLPIEEGGGGGTPAAAAVAPACPACGAPSESRFCENCGWDRDLAAPPPIEQNSGISGDTTIVGGDTGAWTGIGSGSGPLVWVATISADRDHYERMIAMKGPDKDRVEFPDYYPDRRIPLSGPTVLIGKRSASQGIHPEIDLSIAPADIAVSRSHAILHINDNTLTVTDLGSTNGTCVNDSSKPIPRHTPMDLRPGDRIHVGGWTTITLTAEPR